jgi:NAD(P)-dependent dehydrogenase (short-subunit alcohol dehydrogenase family)
LSTPDLNSTPPSSLDEIEVCAVVTGAAGGLGRAVIEASAKRKRIKRLVAVYRNRVASNPVKNQISLNGLDLSTEEGVDRLETAISAHASLGIVLLHCAGMFPAPVPLHKLKMEEFTSSLSANVVSFVGAIKSVVPVMRARHYGRIIAFSSHTQKDAYPYMGAFNAAKGALEAAVQTAANENARFGIAANTINVATLQTEPERLMKPSGRFSDWVPVDALAEFALDLALSTRTGLNGSNLHFWLHSQSFFGSSVFERNSINQSEIDP